MRSENTAPPDIASTFSTLSRRLRIWRVLRWGIYPVEFIHLLDDAACPLPESTIFLFLHRNATPTQTLI